MIRFVRVTRRFGTNVALRGIDLTIERGRVLGVTGSGGAGKTTLLRLAGAILEPTEGAIERPPDLRRLLGFVPDEPFMLDYLTGREILHFMGRCHHLSDPLIRRRSEELLRMFRVDAEADYPTMGYTRAMKRTLALIASLLHDPVYWLVDEPGGLWDTGAASSLRSLIQERREAECAIVIAGRGCLPMEDLCDEMAVLDRGELKYLGPPAMSRIASPSRESIPA